MEAASLKQQARENAGILELGNRKEKIGNRIEKLGNRIGDGEDRKEGMGNRLETLGNGR